MDSASAEIFQLIFWSSVVLVVMTSIAISTIATMDYQGDTLLFADKFKKN
eukprot:CAMPEP_0182449322 /NCGR_PEP_ID=MMETSP1172-20130603/33406_1 /TAXON_ID=708627 /ORGANISM="Timspurckia oligopyrenoides, Strain CCMP3278" /LENGTH=49 /DNA_ID=CAMNT_0024646551 /DNA_START=115 /DNA_END=264 /DNA_ORIENTATION=+